MNDSDETQIARAWRERFPMADITASVGRVQAMDEAIGQSVTATLEREGGPWLVVSVNLWSHSYQTVVDSAGEVAAGKLFRRDGGMSVMGFPLRPEPAQVDLASLWQLLQILHRLNGGPHFSPVVAEAVQELAGKIEATHGVDDVLGKLFRRWSGMFARSAPVTVPDDLSSLG